MYYSKQSSSNNDYYNTYNNNSYPYHNREGYLVLILKILLIILLIGLLFVGYLFIANKTEVTSKMATERERAVQFEITEDMSLEREFSIKKIERGNDSMSQEDMTMLVQLVISKLNEKEEKNQVVDDELYTKELLTQDVDGLYNSSQNINLDKLNRKHVVEKSISLKDTDHYNKVVINRPKDVKYTNDRLAQLSSELSSAIDDDLSDIDNTYYTKEIAVRSNEMRIIVIEKGDTLSKIAYRAYGDYDSYIKIFKANPEVIKNPDQIFIGQRLRIPI